MVEKVTSSASGTAYRNSTNAVASVAWPHRSISPPGVNQRSSYPPSPPAGRAKAVSERAFSVAIACMVSSLGQSCTTRTAAGFPWNTVSVNASTMYCLMSVSFAREEGLSPSPRAGAPSVRSFCRTRASRSA